MALMHKELMKLKRLAVEQGWEVKDEDTNHLKWYPPEDAPNRPESGFYTTARTPSDEHIISTIKSQFEKGGLVLDRSEWKRKEKERANSFQLPPPVDHVRNKSYTKGLSGLSDDEILDAFIETVPDFMLMLSPEQVGHCVEMVRNFDRWYINCACGKNFINSMVLYLHIAKEKNEKFEDDTPVHFPITYVQAQELEKARQGGVVASSEAILNGTVPAPVKTDGIMVPPRLETVPKSPLKMPDSGEPYVVLVFSFINGSSESYKLEDGGYWLYEDVCECHPAQYIIHPTKGKFQMRYHILADKVISVQVFPKSQGEGTDED